MKAEELRINNWYESTKFGSRVRFELSDFVELYHRCDGAVLDEETIESLVKPIKITEKWLLKLGFVHDKAAIALWKEAWSPGHPSQRFDIYWNKNHGVVMSSRYQEFSKYLTMDHIKYVHQLQNLFYAITGEELITNNKSTNSQKKVL